ncbi:hypothetical protein [Paraglaciecola sp.]|uniref:hypothetical protein n=1 Tax=Paraglaciecola sp. TaxID=1920173 RepID=UPI0030F381A5
MLTTGCANVTLSDTTVLRFDMEVTQPKLKTLLHETDRAFDMVIQHPSSAAHVAKYELAKTALNEYLSVMRHSLQKRLKCR